jgi:peroxiredoxin
MKISPAFVAVIVMLAMLWLNSSLSAAPVQENSGAQQASSEAAAIKNPADKNAAKEIRLLFGKLSRAIKAQNIDSASQLMTPVANDDFMGNSLLIAAEFYQDIAEEFELDPNLGDDSELKPAFAAIEKWGLDKVELPESYFNAESDKEFLKAIKEAMKVVLTTIPKNKRVEAVKEVRSATFDMIGELESFAGDLTKIELSEDAKSAIGTIRFSKETLVDLEVISVGDEIDAANFPPIFAKFVRSKNRWKWDGEDIERTMKAWETADLGQMDGFAEFPIIENISLAGKTVDEKSVDLKSLKGKVVLIDFWGTWCRPCVEELPTLKKIYQKLHAKGFEIIGVAGDDATRLKSFFKKKPLPWNNIVDGDGELADAFGIEYFPTTLLVDKAGNHVSSNLSGPSLVKKIVKLLELDPKDYEKFGSTLYQNDKGVDHADEKDDRKPESKEPAGKDGIQK